MALSNSIKGRLLTPQEGCGYSNKIAKPKIVGGMNAKPGAFPWMALLGFGSFKTNRVSFDCGKIRFLNYLFSLIIFEDSIF